MTSMDYRVVFDVTQISFQWWLPLLILIGGALFVVVGWAVRTIGDTATSTKGTFFQIGGVAFSLMAFLFFILMYREYRQVQNAIATHSYSVSEGTVRDFVPMPPGGHAMESFAVNGVRFEYGGAWGSIGFNAALNRGLIHNGVEARITYVGEHIIKVEVR
jgi:hypothetical protein